MRTQFRAPTHHESRQRANRLRDDGLDEVVVGVAEIFQIIRHFLWLMSQHRLKNRLLRVLQAVQAVLLQLQEERRSAARKNHEQREREPFVHFRRARTERRLRC